MIVLKEYGISEIDIKEDCQNEVANASIDHVLVRKVRSDLRTPK